MRAFTNILFLILLLFNAFEATLIWMAFEYQRDSIAAQHCRNQDRPQLMCSGKCVLADQLEEAQDTNDKMPFEWGERQVLNHPGVVIETIDNQSFTDQSKTFASGILRRSQEVTFGIFRPPICS
ncbi:MAG: hypothetical protein AAFW73_23730 [Bacteroidota bacterium]